MAATAPDFFFWTSSVELGEAVLEALELMPLIVPRALAAMLR